MDGELGFAAPADRAIPGRVEEIGGGGGGGGGVDVLGDDEGGGESSVESSSMMVDSMSTEWTDEKHSLYLNSIEESFVNQLYNHSFSSNSLLGWPSRNQKELRTENIYSGQFKVLRGGCWGQVKFERPRTRADIQNETRVLSRNPWIQHFRSASNEKRVDSLSSEHHRSNNIASQANNIVRQSDGIAASGERTSLYQLPVCYTHLCHQSSVGCATEVSDQNFVDDFEGAKKSRVCKKRSRMTFSRAKDQVVPLGETMATSGADELLSSPKGKHAECSSTKAAKLD